MRTHLFRSLFLLCMALLLCAPLSVAAQAEGDQPLGRDLQVEQEILDRLAAIDPAAVPIFQRATQELDRGDNASAKLDFEQVLRMAPGFPDAERRLGYVERLLGDNVAALAHVQAAFDADPSPFNHLALADMLLSQGDAPSNQSALDHAKIAAEALPDDLQAQLILTVAAFTSNDLPLARQANERVLSLAPEQPLGHYFGGILAANDKQWERAEKELLLSRQLGMPADIIQQALDSGIHTQALIYRSLRWGGYSFLGWLAGFAVLFLVGGLLSQATLKAVQQPRLADRQQVGGFEKFVRGIYRAVIGITSAYFYLSIPVLLLVVVAIAAGLIYFFMTLGQIPVRFLLFVGLMALYTLYIVIRSVFARVKEGDPGRPLEPGESPALWSLVKEVAGQVGTRPVEKIYITPAPEVAVTERGGILKKLRGLGQRCLILGLGALPGMTQGQLKAILAHEYGHFSNRDTAGGAFARQVSVSVNLMGYGLAASGLAKWYNPAWLFVNGFYRVFLRITLGASRLQEILADRYAVLAYGVRYFTEGLAHVIRQSVLFNQQVSVEVTGALQQGNPIQNLYTLPPLPAGQASQAAEQKVSEAMGRPTGAYDSHPGYNQRIELLKNITGASTAMGWNDEAPVWDLLTNAAALQDEMTALVQANVNRDRPQSEPA